MADLPTSPASAGSGAGDGPVPAEQHKDSRGVRSDPATTRRPASAATPPQHLPAGLAPSTAPSTSASQYQNVSNQMTSSSSQTLPLAVARGTVASVCVNNRTRAASQPRSVLTQGSRSPASQHQRQSPTSVQQSYSPDRSQHSRHRSRRGANQRRSRDMAGCVASTEACSVAQRSVNLSSNASPTRMALDPSQLSVDVLQTSQHNDVMANTPPASPASRRIAQSRGSGEALPDILNSHLLPPYSTVPRHGDYGLEQPPVGLSEHARRQNRRRQRRTRRQRGGAAPTPGMTQLDGSDKSCCDAGWCCTRCLTVATKFRWVLVFLAALGVVCVGVGIVLGSLHMTVRSTLLTLSLLFIGTSTAK